MAERAAALYAAGIAGSSPGVNEMIGARAGERKGAAMSLYTSMLMAGASITPPLVGAATPLGMEWIFIGIAGMAGLAAFGTWSCRERRTA